MLSLSVLSAIPLKKWALIYPKMAEEAAKALVKEIRQQAPRLGLTIEGPKIISLENDRTDAYLKVLHCTTYLQCFKKLLT